MYNFAHVSAEVTALPRYRMLSFFLATHGLTWVFFIPFAVLQWSVNDFPRNLLFFAGGLGPLVAALLFVRGTRDATYMREYAARIISFGRISGRWWSAILLLPPAVTLSGIVIAAVLTGGSLQPDNLLNISTIRNVTVFYILLMLLAPLIEEIAWRGYGQDALHSRFGLAATSLILGVLWWSWHLPLFFMADTYQSGLGLLTVQSLEFLVWCVATAFVMTWIYHGTTGSILAAIVYHFMLNVANELLLTDAAAEIARSAIQIALALVLILVLPRLKRDDGTRRVEMWRPARSN